MKSKNNIWFEFLIAVCCLCMIFLIWKIGYQSMKSEIEFKNEIQNSELNTAFEIEDEDFGMCEPIEIENPSVYPLSDYDRWYVECIVAGEAGYEPLLGKMAVAQCILNAMKQDGLTASEVCKTYQYSGWMREGFETNYPEDWAEVQQAVWCVFDNGEKVTEENILWFYAPKYSSGSWHNTQKFVIEISNHRFYAPWN